MPFAQRRCGSIWKGLTNDNAQQQYYLTDIIHGISRDGGQIRSITTTVDEPEYDLLCSDVTQPSDLALIEGHLSSPRGLATAEEIEVEKCAAAIAAGRPRGQVLSIARQLETLLAVVGQGAQEFADDEPVALGISGGRLRIAFMHPDMTRFYGPAWQMPIGAGEEEGDEADHRADTSHQRSPDPPLSHGTGVSGVVNSIPADAPAMFPGEENRRHARI